MLGSNSLPDPGAKIFILSHILNSHENNVIENKTIIDSDFVHLCLPNIFLIIHMYVHYIIKTNIA